MKKNTFLCISLVTQFTRLCYRTAYVNIIVIVLTRRKFNSKLLLMSKEILEPKKSKVWDLVCKIIIAVVSAIAGIITGSETSIMSNLLN